ncbi:hypothetical protein [Ottowia thiooxydans]|uniref:hypothetical protein n=1 Tax=Ottowia thiooxydans TaxID=219182 RepID=UPI00048DB409|nr:hypothetical protein [Ottowia thiooxydans]
MTKRFRSPTDTPLHVALTSGHTAVIPPEGIDLPQVFQREAIARGALLAEGATDEDKTQVLNRALVVRETMQAMIAGGDKDDFTGDGKPNLMRLKSKAGFSVSREEADAVFAELTKQE